MTRALGLQARVTLSLDRFTLDVELEAHARVTGLFGASGCGKTAFLETIAGLRPHSRGRISFDGEVWQDSSNRTFLPPEKRGVGYVPQSGLLFPHLSVGQNLESGLRRAKRGGADGAHPLDTVVELLELSDLLDRDPATLSGGERQRVALGRALCSAPRLMLLDEPLAALDHPLRHRILPFLRRIREEFAVPMILVSHDPLEVQALCDDLVVLDRGTVIGRGTPREILTDPAVFPLAKERGFENIVPSTLIESEESRSRVRLGESGSAISLDLPPTLQQVGTACLVGIPARDILVAVDRPTGLSARNVLPAVVEEISSVTGTRLLKARLSAELPPLAVEIGNAAVAELELAAGSRVYLVIKAMSCTLYDETPAVPIRRDL